MMKISKYQIFLIILFIAHSGHGAINPKYSDGWLLENYLVFLFVPLILIVSIYFKLSNLSYTLITIFMILHVIGSHYTYAETPFGYILQDWFGSARNMYDRLVHFSFGFLIAYPIREVFVRLGRTKGLWGFYFPIELTLGFSALYEIIEWLTVQATSPGAGLAFLGAQGDIWDAQKDMALAGIGSVITMIIIAVINLIYNRNFKSEIKESLHIEKGDRPLGEIKLKEWMKRR